MKKSEEELNEIIEKMADLLVNIVWDMPANDILYYSKKASNVKADKVDPTLTESFAYGSE